MIVLVASCAAYADAWAAWHSLWQTAWPACPYRVVLVTDTIPNRAPSDFDAFVVGVDLGWSANLRAALSALRPDGVFLLMQEDFFVTEPIDASALAAACVIARRGDAACVRLYPCPGPRDETPIATLGHHALGEVRPGEPYRISCQAAVWRADYLDATLMAGAADGGGAASFEIAGTKAMAERPGRVFSVLRTGTHPPIQYLCSAITRGRWTQDARRLCAERGISLPGCRATEDA